MLDVDSEQFQFSLLDVVHWCALHHGTLVRGSPEIAERRNQFELATRLFEEARSIADRMWPETDPGKRAQALLSQLCESLGSLESRLRNPTLMPSRAIDELRTDVDWFQAVSEVVSKRRAQNKENPPAKDHSVIAGSGRLLVYFPHDNLADSAAQVASNSFFDADNVPPWDIWVWFSDGALISWVPLGLIEVAQMGIDANPEECIQWDSAIRS